jgi:hypothetical protein
VDQVFVLRPELVFFRRRRRLRRRFLLRRPVSELLAAETLCEAGYVPENDMVTPFVVGLYLRHPLSALAMKYQ